MSSVFLSCSEDKYRNTFHVFLSLMLGISLCFMSRDSFLGGDSVFVGSFYDACCSHCVFVAKGWPVVCVCGIHLLFENGIEKCVSDDHCLSLVGKPYDLGDGFLYLALMIDPYKLHNS